MHGLDSVQVSRGPRPEPSGQAEYQPFLGFCANVLIDDVESFYLAVGVLFIPSCPGTEAFDVSW